MNHVLSLGLIPTNSSLCYSNGELSENIRNTLSFAMTTQYCNHLNARIPQSKSLIKCTIKLLHLSYGWCHEIEESKPYRELPRYLGKKLVSSSTRTVRFVNEQIKVSVSLERDLIRRRKSIFMTKMELSSKVWDSYCYFQENWSK